VSTERLLLWGAGGHGAVVLDAISTELASNTLVEVVDNDPLLHGQTLLGVPISAPPDHEIDGQFFHVSIGRNDVRAAVFSKLLAARALPMTIIHRYAVISLHSIISTGCFVAAGAIIAPRVSIGSGCIINHGAVIDHDCKLDAFCHIAPTASLGGNVTVGERAMVGAGANILPGTTIGPGAIIGAGAVVHRTVPAGATVVGIPAKARE
jgi:sugar O-acyltransferase (sialic acid O-acetyltransferase NeuD family)